MTRTPLPDPTAVPFSRIKVRVGALVFCGAEIALIRRDRCGSPLYVLPGGNVVDGEDFTTALRRELAEELDLDVERAEGGELLWILDQRVSRPGRTPPPRKIHLLHRLHITPEIRARLAAHERDELPDGSHEVGTIVWIDYRETAELPVFPPITGPLTALPTPHAPTTDAALPPVTDETYTWL
ncbi:NUDIX hydrolase [Embleya sp. NPDC055664]